MFKKKHRPTATRKPVEVDNVDDDQHVIYNRDNDNDNHDKQRHSDKSPALR